MNAFFGLFLASKESLVLSLRGATKFGIHLMNALLHPFDFLVELLGLQVRPTVVNPSQMVQFFLRYKTVDAFLLLDNIQVRTDIFVLDLSKLD